MSNKVNIDFGVADQMDLFHREAVLLLYYNIGKGFPIEGSHRRLLERGLIKKLGLGIYQLTPEGESTLNKLLNLTKQKIQNNESIVILANNLRSIFPEGRKNGTAYYWRDTEKGIQKKIISYLIKYKHDHEDILRATQEYVNSFKGDFKYMQLLKYFIEKNGTSQLASFVENLGQTTKDDFDCFKELV